MESAQEDLIYEGFLLKRKDMMSPLSYKGLNPYSSSALSWKNQMSEKFTWTRYWFKLQNTTLYFYLTSEAQSTSLRGQYYINSVQSVRKVAGMDFTFEIVMKNGRRKLLAADTAQLCDTWMEFLWKSMQLPGPGRHTSSCTWYDVPHLLQMAKSGAGVLSLPLNAAAPLDPSPGSMEAETADGDNPCLACHDLQTSQDFQNMNVGDNSAYAGQA